MQKQPNPVDIHVGKLIRSCRVQAGISQEKLGAVLGITFQQIQKYEKGVNRVSASRMQAIASTLGVTPAYFFDGLPADGGAPSSQVTTAAHFLATREGAEILALWPSIQAAGGTETVLQLMRLVARRELRTAREAA